MRNSRGRWWKSVAFGILGVAVLLGVGCLKRRIDAARVQTQQTLCVHNLHFMANALHRYAADHEGKFPERFSQLYPEYLTTVEVLVCPEVARRETGRADAGKLTADALDALCSYELAPGRRIDDPAETLLAWERGDYHGGRGHSVLYVDGRGGWDPPEAWRGKDASPGD